MSKYNTNDMINTLKEFIDNYYTINEDNIEVPDVDLMYDAVKSFISKYESVDSKIVIYEAIHKLPDEYIELPICDMLKDEIISDLFRDKHNYWDIATKCRNISNEIHEELFNKMVRIHQKSMNSKFDIDNSIYGIDYQYELYDYLRNLEVPEFYIYHIKMIVDSNDYFKKYIHAISM